MSEIERDTARLVTSTDKTASKELLAIGELLGVSEGDFSDRARETIHRLFKKLILDKSSLAPNSLNGEQKPQVNKTPEQILYDQYLKDTSDINFDKIPKNGENPEPKAESSLLSPLQWVQDHTCHYRAVVNDKGKFIIYCDTKKIPLEVCMTRQKRYIFMQKKCQPIDRPKPLPPQKHFQEQKTRPYKGDGEGSYGPFSIGDGYPT